MKHPETMSLNKKVGLSLFDDTHLTIMNLTRDSKAMTSGPEINEFSFARSIDQVDRYLARLQDLPTQTEFEEKVTQGMWKAVTEQPDPPSKVKYTELPEQAHGLIGTYENENGVTEPWWLKGFDWKASFGGESVTLRGNGLETFAGNFDRERTLIHRPTFRSENPRGHTFFIDAYGALESIRTNLEERITPASGASFPTLPESVFVVEKGLIKPTDTFGKWVDEFLSLLPGIGAEPTALYLAHTGTSFEAAKSALSEELFEKVDTAVSFNRRSNIVSEFDTILGLSRVFDRVIPVDESCENLSGLQYQLYKGFFEAFDTQDEIAREIFDTVRRKEPTTLDNVGHGVFTRIACGTPLIRHLDDRPKLMSVSMYAPTTNKSGYMDQGYQDLSQMLETYGWFDDA